jgi:hypothetical protein
MGFKCEVLGIADAPKLLIIPGSDIPGCDALCEYYDAVIVRFHHPSAAAPDNDHFSVFRR